MFVIKVFSVTARKLQTLHTILSSVQNSVVVNLILLCLKTIYTKVSNFLGLSVIILFTTSSGIPLSFILGTIHSSMWPYP